MANEVAHLLAKHLRSLSSAARVDGLPDRELVERFATQRDEDAFAALVRRHGPMVLRVCRRVLHDVHDAEDAFQATFLVLSRKAASLRRVESVGCFLHGVAYRLALKARTQLARQRTREVGATAERHADDLLAELSVREAQAILDEELARLPEKYRGPLVLCCLEGRTRDEAARQLGWSAKLVKSRLEQGRERLRHRLTLRGLTLPVALVATLLAEEAAPAVLPAALMQPTIQAAIAWPSNSVSASVALLAESALAGTGYVKTKVVVGLLLLTSVLAAGVGALAPPPVADAPGSPPRQAAESPKSKEQPPARTDRFGDPLPPGAVARIGTVRFRDGDVIHSLAYSPDGKMLASGTIAYRDNRIRLWDAATGKQLFALQPTLNQVLALAFSRDSKRLACACEERGPSSHGVHVWDTATGKEILALRQSHVAGRTVAFSPDDRYLAAADYDTVRLWDIASGKESRSFQERGKAIDSFTLSPDGKILVTAGDDTIRLWDAVKGKKLHPLKIAKSARKYAGRSLAFSPDGKILASGGPDGSVYFWDAATGHERLTIPGHNKWRNARGFSQEGLALVVFSPDGKYLAAGNEGIVFDAATGKERCQLENFHCWIRSLVFSPDGKTLAGEGPNRIRFWDAATGKEVFKYPAHREPVRSVVFSPDGKTVFTASWENSVGTWETATGRVCFRLQGPRRSALDWHHNEIAVAPDGKTAAAWLAGVLYSWDVRRQKVVREHSDAAASGFDSRHGLAFSPQGRLLAAGWKNEDKRIRIWAEGAAKEPRLLKVHESGNNGLIFSPDGKTLASGSPGGIAGLWDVATGKELRTLPGFNLMNRRRAGSAFVAVFSMAFSPDSKTLALGGSDGTIGLWDKASGREFSHLVSSSKGKWVEALAFTPDGKTLAAGYQDGTVRFWEAATGKLRREWATHTGNIRALAFSPDGKLLASAGSDTTVLIWTAHEQTKPRDVSSNELETLWNALAGDDGAKAYRAIGILRAASRQTVPFLKTHLHPGAAVDAKHLAGLIAGLDDERFAIREKAATELAKYGDRAEPALRKILEGKPSLEVRRRVEAILEEFNRPLSAERLREVRAVEALEQIGTLPAQEVLRALAEGAPGARLTWEAKAALERLAQASRTTP